MTDCDRLLAALSDGREHSAAELYGLHMIVHSRISDLRRRGHQITLRRVPGVKGPAAYRYRLEPLEGAATTPAAPSSGIGRTDAIKADPLGAGPLDTQLTLEAA